MRGRNGPGLQHKPKNKPARGRSSLPSTSDEESGITNAEDVAELQRLIAEVRKEQKKPKKAKLASTPSVAELDDKEDEEEDNELEEEEQALRAMQHEDESSEGLDVAAEETTSRQDRTANEAQAMRALAAELSLPDFEQSFALQLEEGEEAFPANVEDDKLRESAFASLARRAVSEGRAELRRLKLPFARPHDFLAEMLKSDDHMARVKRRILFEQEKIRVVEARKAAARNRKRNKEVKKARAGQRSEQKAKASSLSASFRDRNNVNGNSKRLKKAARPGKSKRMKSGK